MSSRIQFAAMSLILVLGTFLLLFNRNSSSHQQTRIVLLKDSLQHNVKYEKRTNIFSSWIKIHQFRNAMKEFSVKDSLSRKDLEDIKNIDQQLNQILHERN